MIDRVVMVICHCAHEGDGVVVACQPLKEIEIRNAGYGSTMMWRGTEAFYVSSMAICLRARILYINE